MNLAIIGIGYVGLVSGACFSEFGHHVTCVDKDQQKIDALNRGETPIYEPGLADLLTTNVAAGRLLFTKNLGAAIDDADAVFIAVGTPSRRGDGHADLSYVFEVVRQAVEATQKPLLLVTKSTVPVGTGAEIIRIIANMGCAKRISVATNPEFLRGGSAIEDFMHPDRIIVGTNDERAQDIITAIYRPLFLNKTPMLLTSLETAELIKYASNAFLATKISFINEIADLCEEVGANVQEVAAGMGLDNRIGPKFLHAGPGYGGSCFPKDTVALLRSAEIANVPLRIIDAVVQANNARMRRMAQKIIAACGGSVRGMKIAILGLTFKPNTDDLRESPSLVVIPRLTGEGAEIVAYDPEGMREARSILPDISYASDPYEAMKGADALVILTEWNQFRALDFYKIKTLMKSPRVIDLRNIYADSNLSESGFFYTAIGHPKTQSAIKAAKQKVN